MAQCVIIYGKSGSGKSRSLKNFNEDEILLVNVEDKALPFRNKFKNVINTDNMTVIANALKEMKQNVAVIDDAGYIMVNMFMARHRNMRGGAVYELYNDIADVFYSLIKFIKRELPPEKIVYIIMHEDTVSETGQTKLKTIGKLLDDKCCIEGKVTIVLRCISEDGKHYFKTMTDGTDITKAPEGMFDNEYIDNDLKAVDIAIREYYK